MSRLKLLGTEACGNSLHAGIRPRRAEKGENVMGCTKHKDQQERGYRINLYPEFELMEQDCQLCI
jgi:hypothetical protein